MTASLLPTMFVGDAQREEFRDTAAWLIGRGAVAAGDVTKGLAIVREGFAPALIVVAEAWPGRYSANDVEELRRAAPLARLVRLLGTWSEGEGRTGKPWPASTRGNWQRWNGVRPTDLSRLSQPVTANENDRLLRVCVPEASNFHAALSQVIAIYARSRESAESLDDLFSQRGWNAIWIRSVNAAVPGNVDCAVFDARNNSAGELKALAALREALGEMPIVALVGFPRVDDLERFKAAGAAAVVSKPYLAEDLQWQIEQLLQSAAS